MKQRYSAPRFVIMMLSMLPMSFGVTLFTLSGFGNDPFSAMNMAIAAFTGLSFGTAQLIINALLFTLVLILERSLFGLGTVVNMVAIGYLVDFFKWLWLLVLPQAETLLPRILLLLAGILVLSFGAALYFTVNLGVAPYDSTAFLLEKRTPMNYTVARMLTDATCVAVCLSLGGMVGLGTLFSAFCFGPFITFFRVHCAQPLLRQCERGASEEKQP